MQKLFNKILRTGNFPDKLKLADITPVFKNNNPLEKGNYIPASVLPVVSKIFERIMQKQVTIFTEKPLVHSRHWFLWSKAEKKLDQKGYAGAVLMDLS